MTEPFTEAEVVRCRHWANYRPVPCPPGCPYGSWPSRMFRSTLFGGGWRLRRRYRSRFNDEGAPPRSRS